MNKHYTKIFILLFITLLCFSMFSIVVSCNNQENNNDTSNGVNNNDNQENSEGLINKHTDLTLDDSNYEIHYFAQWDLEIDFPYHPVDGYWEEMKEVGYFKIYYDDAGRIIQHERIQNDNALRIARYSYENNIKIIKWYKNFNLDGNALGCDSIKYYPSNWIESLTEYDKNEKVILEINYEELKKEGEGFKRLNYISNANNEKKIYIETIYVENKLSNSPKYLRKKETKKIAFGKYKDQWFSISRYSQEGELDRIDDNETINEDEQTYSTYIEEQFPEYFSASGFLY